MAIGPVIHRISVPMHQDWIIGGHFKENPAADSGAVWVLILIRIGRVVVYREKERRFRPYA